MDRPPLHRDPSSQPAKSILKNNDAQPQSVHWDEVNLSLNEVNRDSTQRIDEPKTPWVNYNAETDEVMDLDKIPGLALGPREGSSRSSSFSGSRRGSDVSERKMVVVEDHGPGVDAEDEGADEETRAARKEFKSRRSSHYGGEGEVMKRLKAQVQAEEESALDDDEDDVIGEEARRNARANSAVNGVSGQVKIPPVPPLPNSS